MAQLLVRNLETQLCSLTHSSQPEALQHPAVGRAHLLEFLSRRHKHDVLQIAVGPAHADDPVAFRCAGALNASRRSAADGEVGPLSTAQPGICLRQLCHQLLRVGYEVIALT